MHDEPSVTADPDGWKASADAWLREVGQDGDFARRVVLDARDYRLATAESMIVEDASFDLVVSYLSLIDIADLDAATRRMTAALRPGGTLLVANLTSFLTAGQPAGWTHDADGRARFCIDEYLAERTYFAMWRGIRIANRHRPLGRYMTLFLELGLELRSFVEPEPLFDHPKSARYRRVPYFHIMEWRKPA